MYGDLVKCMTDDGECIGIKDTIYEVNTNRCNLIPNIVIPETVGQYTGLTDKNGKKIFEGDILKFDDEIWSSYYTSCGTEYDSWKIENYGVVGFDDDYAKYDFVKYKYNENSVEADLHENNTIEFADFVKDLEVIGNIHDNPELLEVEQMTPQEAIKLINDMEFAEKYQGKQEYTDMLLLCKKALEKQIPKKPTFEGGGYADDGGLMYDTWICPCCEKDYELDYEEYEFCPNCGQAIKWE